MVALPDAEVGVFEAGAGDAPVAEDGKLVAWSPYRGWGQFAGWLAWIGGERIGRIDVDKDGICQWFVSLPSEERSIDGITLDIEGAKTVVELWARNWCMRAGLVPAGLVNPVANPMESAAAVLDHIFGEHGELSIEALSIALIDTAPRTDEEIEADPAFDPGG